jgi:DNA-binding beta-propeller fold protein YncE
MFAAARDIAVSPGGEVYLIPESGHGIMYFSPTGSFIGGWEPEDSFQGWDPVSITPEGNVLIGDGDQLNWKYFSPSGSLLASLEFKAEINGEVHACRGDTAIGPDGTTYILESHDDRVCYFDAGGNFLGRWGSPGSGAGEFEYPSAIAVGHDGTVYVLDGCSDPTLLRVQFFSARGEYRGEIRHIRQGDYWLFRDIAVAPDNTLYFTDAAEDRVVYFRRVEAEN